MEHNAESCVRKRQAHQRVILERLRERVDMLREEIKRIIELSEYVEDIANSESNIRSIMEDIAVRDVYASKKYNQNFDPINEKKK